MLLHAAVASVGVNFADPVAVAVDTVDLVAAAVAVAVEIAIVVVLWF